MRDKNLRVLKMYLAVSNEEMKSKDSISKGRSGIEQCSRGEVLKPDYFDFHL